MDSKLFYQLQGRMDILSEEILQMKARMLYYRDHMTELNEDIADVYLNLYEIYKIFEVEDEQHLKKDKKDLVKKREVPQEVPLKESSKPSSTGKHRRVKSEQAESIKRAEKRQFLKNMLLHNKSEFSINLNRNNEFFPELQKILIERKRLKH